MSKQIKIFIKAQLEEKPEVRKKYLKKLNVIRKGRFVKVKNVDEIL